MRFFRSYLAYLRDNPEGYWFKRRLFGWGWTPATWQGWVVILIYLVMVIALALTVDESSPTREVFFTFLLPLIILTSLLIRICYQKGERPKWSWGIPKKYK